MYDDIMSPPINDKDIKHLYLAEQMLLLWLDAQIKLTSKGPSITYFPIICVSICFILCVGGGEDLGSRKVYAMLWFCLKTISIPWLNWLAAICLHPQVPFLLSPNSAHFWLRTSNNVSESANPVINQSNWLICRSYLFKSVINTLNSFNSI